MACARCPTSCFEDEATEHRDITEPSTDGSSISHFEDKNTAVFLKGIPENVHEEFIEMFFENKKNFTDVKVHSVCLDRDDGTAIVKFQDKQAANVVLEKEHIIMRHARVHIKSYHPEQQILEITQSEDNRELPRVVLKDLPDDVDQEDIEMVLCSTKRVGNIEVVDIDYKDENSLAIVTLGNQKSLETLLAKSPLTIFGENVHVVLHESMKQPKVLVSRLPENVKYEDVEMLFENRRKFDDTKPLDIKFNEGDLSAILTYDTESSVSFVVNRCPLKMRGRELLLRKLPIDETMCSDKMIAGNKIDKPQTQLLVENIPDGVDKEIVEMFFESRKLKSCEVVDVKFDEQNRNAVVRLAKPEHVQLVLESRPLCLRNQELSVQIYVPKPLDTIMIKGPPDVVNANSLDILELYFDNENKSGGSGIVENKTTFDAENNIAFVTFKEERVAERVVLRQNHYLRGRHLYVTLLRPTRSTKRQNLTRNTQKKPTYTIRVRGMKKISTRESVNLYFESKKRAGGGDIESRYTDEEDDDTVYITFNEENAAKAVVDREHHTVDGVDLTVSLHSPPIQTTPSYTNKILIKGLNAKITESLLGLFLEAKANYTLVDGSLTYHAVRDDVSPLKIRFINSSQFATISLDAQMSMCYAALAWSEETSSVEISCTLTTEVKNCIALACN